MHTPRLKSKVVSLRHFLYVIKTISAKCTQQKTYYDWAVTGPRKIQIKYIVRRLDKNTYNLKFDVYRSTLGLDWF